MVMALDELTDVLPDERYAPGRNDEEIGKLISIFLREQKEEVHRVFVLKYFYFESNRAIAEKYGFTERKVTNMLARTRNKGSIIFFVGLTLPRYSFSKPSASLDRNLRQCLW